MATAQKFLVCDNSTNANFLSWVSGFSSFLATVGWLQSVDTGQVMLSGMNLTAVSMGGTTATYTYNTLTGLALIVGRTLTITGMTNAGNNGTFRITSLGTGTFSVTNASGVNETGSTGLVTIYATVPGSGASVYEIWQPGDGLTNFYLKLSYGNSSGSTNSPTIAMGSSTSTNGAGTLTGFYFSLPNAAVQSYTAPSTSTPYECDFSGDPGRLSILLWRTAPNYAPQVFAVQRSLNSTGTPTGSYVTLWESGLQLSTLPNAGCQQSLHFTLGAAPVMPARNFSGTNNSGWAVVAADFTVANSVSIFNGGIPISMSYPCVGIWDYPCTVVGIMWGGDVQEGVPFSLVNQYGQTKTYIGSALTPLNQTKTPSSNTVSVTATLVEYD